MKQSVKTTLLAVATGLLTGSMNANISENSELKKQNADVTAPVPDFAYLNNQADAATEVSLRVLNIGDSRTVGMYFSENVKKYSNTVDAQDVAGNHWFAKVGQGLSWFENNMDNVQKLVKDCDVVVINLGINDLAASGNSQTVAAKYIRCLNGLADDWAMQGKRVFFSASNPVGPQYRGSHVFNQKIDNFNRLVQEGLSNNIGFIDTNNFIKEHLTSRDFDSAGLHYTAKINRKIHQFIESQIATEIAKTNGNYNLLSAMQNNGGRNL